MTKKLQVDETLEEKFETKALIAAGKQPLSIKQAEELLLQGEMVQTHYGLRYRLSEGFLESSSSLRGWSRDGGRPCFMGEPFLLYEGKGRD